MNCKHCGLPAKDHIAKDSRILPCSVVMLIKTRGSRACEDSRFVKSRNRDKTRSAIKDRADEAKK